MAGGAVDALKVPDGLASLWEVVCQEASTILTVKDPSEPPLMAHQWTQVQDLYHKQVTRHGRLSLCVLHTEGTTQVVNLHDQLRLTMLKRLSA